MKIHNVKLITLVMSMFLIAGCGGDGNKNEVSLDSLLITVPDNISPVAQVAKINISTTQGKNITLDATNSSDEDGAIVNYEWQLADGTILGNGKQLSYNTTSLKAGTYKVRLIVTDDAGATGVVEFTINIREKPVTPPPPSPSPSPTPDTTPPVITVTGGNNTSVVLLNTYTDAGATATDDVDGTVSVTTTGSVDTSTLGIYTITYTATDVAGNTATATRTVTVTLITHNGTVYGTVTSPYTGRIWLDRNLGAAQVCTMSNDSACYGDYYQWGRNFDGHQDSLAGLTTTRMTSIHNVGALFVHSNWDWVSPGVDDNGTLRSAEWSKLDGSSICPIGFRVPTIGELNAETVDQGVSTATDAYNNFLKLPAAGYHDGDDNGLMKQVDTFVNLFSSTPIANSEDAENLQIGGSDDDSRGDGSSIRCIKG